MERAGVAGEAAAAALVKEVAAGSCTWGRVDIRRQAKVAGMC